MLATRPLPDGTVATNRAIDGKETRGSQCGCPHSSIRAHQSLPL